MENSQDRAPATQQAAATQGEYPCHKCHRKFKTFRGSVQHLRSCKVQVNHSENTNNRVVPEINLQAERTNTEQAPEGENRVRNEPENFYWGAVKGSVIENDINVCYEKIVFWKKNMFTLPNGAAGKNFIRELTRLLTAWHEDSPLKNVAMKAIHVMPALLLQKPAKNSKAKDHTDALNRRLELWHKGDLTRLLEEAETLQQRLPNVTKKKDLAAISKQFKDKMQKGDLNSAIKVLTNNMSGGVLPLNDETLKTLHDKHPQGKDIDDNIMLQGPIKPIHPIVYNAIDETTIIKAVKMTKGGAGPSGMDAMSWRKPLLSKVYGDSGRDLRSSFSKVIQKICAIDVIDNSLEAYLACRLVPLNKNPGLRPIGVGEVLRRIAGKAVMLIAKEDLKNSCSTVQMCAGHEAGCEAAIHSMKYVFESAESEAVLLVDASNAFNNINRKAILHNVRILCPILACYVNNCYRLPARLFVVGGREIQSCEGTTQGDPLGMAIYAIGLTPLLDQLAFQTRAQMVAFADDLTAATTIRGLFQWWKCLIEIGPRYGYYPEPTKSYLIVKNGDIRGAKEHFTGTKVQITSTGQRHLGAVIGSKEFREWYCNQKISDWIKEISLLSDVALTEPQAAYACYVSAYQHKFTYFLRTIPGIEDNLAPLEEVVRHRLMPAILGGHLVNDDERALLSLPPRLGGLGIKNVQESAPTDYLNSVEVTKPLCQKILGAEMNGVAKTKSEIKQRKNEIYKEKLELLRGKMNDEERRRNDANQESGSYNWLTALPLKEHGYDLNKEQFWDALRIRYNWELPRLASVCACGNKFNLAHALSCKKGGFVTIRHNEIRNITASLLNEVCSDVRKEPPLIELTGEQMEERTANTTREARLDISALGFWTPGQKAFFDVRVFDLNAMRYRNKELKRCYESNEDEKKKKYNQRVLQVENATFSPLVFSTHGGMGRECRTFYQRLSEMVADKRGIAISDATTFVRTRISFSLLRSMLLCLRGSRTTRRLPETDEVDISLVNFESEITEQY